MYQALYRKWRPKIFDDVIGQEHITETLKTQVRTGHLSHAYIMIGTRGTGKTTCARILAKAVNCENPVDGNPCNKCRTCLGIDEGSILDIVELDAASNTGVDNVRDLREEAVFSPASAKKRVYIIDEVHMLSLAAFNALLKIIEEPPPHLMFILATTELQKVPATILSRCQRHSFRRIPTERMSTYLQEVAGRENYLLDKPAALQIARLADGSVRDALSILDQCSANEHITTETVSETMGLAGNGNLIQLLYAIIRHDSAEALILFQRIWLDGKEPASFLGELNGLIRDVLIVKAAPAGAEELISGNFERDVLNAFSSSMTKEELLYCADTIQESLIRIRQIRNPRTAAEICIVTLCDSRTAESLLSLRARISELEQELKDSIPAAVSKQESTPKTDQEEIKSSESVNRLVPEDLRIKTALDREESLHMKEKPESVCTDIKSESKDTSTMEKAILELVKDRLPIELRFTINDPERFRLTVRDKVLMLESVPGFLSERLKKPEVRAAFASAAEMVLGFPITVQFSELTKNQREIRDLNELRQFKEVTFIS